ncbi:DUF481 domain-containing protein [Simiduia sp. 21SJ11W-1]|uniref:DUF481 domain-containing protein n=1 Tax=Simiduia sp. 21SJ11W-1 TaxID=2909669 RepID=UPI00209CE95F|nr:DUF481 domain-containing protein [Simiduia sp. 21SJ11W-1]UTA48899.1 DUF481 domain-containing protein [Simiduia sp. 21SJ11W-1]
MKWLVPVLLIVAQSAFAGKLTLKNGDTLSGEIKSMDASNVVWVSDALGEMVIAKSKIDNLESSELVKIDGHDEACAIVGMDGPKVKFSCAGGSSGDAPLLTINKVEPYEDFLMGSSTYTGKISLTGFQDRGNKIEDTWVFDAFNEYRRGDYRHGGKLQFDSKSKDPEPKQERGLAEYQFDWFFAERWFWTNTLAYSFDDAKAIEQKYRAGSGIGYQFWENDITALSVRGGASYVDEYFKAPDVITPDYEERDQRAAWTAGLNYRHKFAFGGEFFHSSNYAVSNEDNQNWQLDADTGFTMPLVGGVFGEVKHEYDYNNQPQPDTKKLDTRITVGVGYQW